MFVLNSTMMTPISILLLLLAFFSIPTEQSTRHSTNYGGHFCLNTTGNYTQGSTFQHNLNTLLSILESNSSSSSFFETTTGDSASIDHIFGRYYCRHNLSLETCNACVKTATKRIVAECPTAKEAVFVYEYCTLLYLNSSARLDDYDVADQPVTLLFSKVIDVDQFYPVLVGTMNRLINESAYKPTSEGFATGEAKVSQLETLYSLTQCSPDMSGVLCERCLRNAMYHIDLCCKDAADMLFFYPSCQLRYSAVAPFYVVRASPAQMAISPAPPAVPQAAASSDNHQPLQGNEAVALSIRNILEIGVITALITVMLILSN